MKYIVTILDSEEVIFTFPRSVDHDRFAEAISAIRFGSSQNWTRKLRDGEIISAGFVCGGMCHGYSETLALKSRLVDTELLRKSLGK